MPASTSASHRPRRRTVNEINMVPFIDVMLVLLIIFMVTAPMLTPGAINVPSAGKSARPPARQVAHVLLDKDGSIRLKTPDQGTQSLTLQQLGSTAARWQSAQANDSAVLIQADKTLPYENVVAALSALQGAGVQRVALGVISPAK